MFAPAGKTKRGSCCKMKTMSPKLQRFNNFVIEYQVNFCNESKGDIITVQYCEVLIDVHI
jgi:hypothetical protein